MAKIERYNGNLKAFGSESTGTERTIFGDTAQSNTLDGNITSDLFRGWGIIGPEFNPTKQDFNGIGFTLGQLIAYLHQQGIPEWNTSQEYYRGSVVTTLAGIYRLKNGGDPTVEPDSDNGTNWELAPTRAQVDAKANQATTYTETEVDSLLNAKANKSTTYTETETYTKTEANSLLDDKAAISGQVFTGNVTAPNLSGTNTGDQTNITGNAGTVSNISTSQVGSATAGLGAGGVGTYGFFTANSGGLGFGGLISGGNLNPSNAEGAPRGATIYGTWRAMGHVSYSSGNDGKTTLFLRIS